MTVREYRYYLKVERAMSPNTVTSYCRDVTVFQKWLEAKAGKRIEDTTADDIVKYLEVRAESAGHPAAGKAGKANSYGKNSAGGIERVSKRTQARILSAFRSFFNWLIAEGSMKENPCDGVDAPKLGKYLPQVLSVEEVEAILEAVPLGDWRGKRDRAALELLYGCGLRVSEAATLKISQLFFNEGFVRVFGKGSKERIVPMGEVAADAVLDYMAVRPDPDEKYADTLLLNKNGTALSRVSLFNIVKKYAREAGISKEISPHTFRHSFATHLIENGADLRVVQEMLGHESILTTEIYTHIDQKAWQAAVLACHPRK